jgi:hypothetical protein
MLTRRLSTIARISTRTHSVPRQWRAVTTSASRVHEASARPLGSSSFFEHVEVISFGLRSMIIVSCVMNNDALTEPPLFLQPEEDVQCAGREAQVHRRALGPTLAECVQCTTVSCRCRGRRHPRQALGNGHRDV